jgi:hypothetical protein
VSIEALLEPVAAAALKEESSISAGAVKGSPLVSSEEPSEAWALSPHALKASTQIRHARMNPMMLVNRMLRSSVTFHPLCCFRVETRSEKAIDLPKKNLWLVDILYRAKPQRESRRTSDASGIKKRASYCAQNKRNNGS